MKKLNSDLPYMDIVEGTLTIHLLHISISPKVFTIISFTSCGPGSCPPTLPVDICDPACGPSIPCNRTQLCCPTACGGAMCVDAMTPRHFVTLVKKGRCPEFPRGPWVCTHTCTGDSDCPRTLKCCANRCGALTCQKAELEEYPTEEPLLT